MYKQKSKLSIFSKIILTLILILNVLLIVACGGGGGGGKKSNGGSTGSNPAQQTKSTNNTTNTTSTTNGGETSTGTNTGTTSTNAGSGGGTSTGTGTGSNSTVITNTTNNGGITSTGIGTICPTEQSISIINSGDVTSLRSYFGECELHTYNGTVKQFRLPNTLRRMIGGWKFNDYANITLKQLGITKDEALSSYITCNASGYGDNYIGFIDTYDNFIRPHACQLDNITFNINELAKAGQQVNAIDFVIINNNFYRNGTSLQFVKCGLSKDGKEIIAKTDTFPGNSPHAENHDSYNAHFVFDVKAINPPINILDKITIECDTNTSGVDGKPFSFDDYARDGIFGRAIDKQ